MTKYSSPIRRPMIGVSRIVDDHWYKVQRKAESEGKPIDAGFRRQRCLTPTRFRVFLQINVVAAIAGECVVNLTEMARHSTRKGGFSDPKTVKEAFLFLGREGLIDYTKIGQRYRISVPPPHRCTLPKEVELMDLSVNAIRLLYHLQRVCEMELGYCIQSIETLCRYTGVCPDTVIKARNELESARVITVEKRGIQKRFTENEKDERPTRTKQQSHRIEVAPILNNSSGPQLITLPGGRNFCDANNHHGLPMATSEGRKTNHGSQICLEAKEFYEAYPKDKRTRIDLKEFEPLYSEAIGSGTITHERLMEALDALTRSESWTKEGGRYRPRIENFFRDGQYLKVDLGITGKPWKPWLRKGWNEEASRLTGEDCSRMSFERFWNNHPRHREEIREWCEQSDQPFVYSR